MDMKRETLTLTTTQRHGLEQRLAILRTAQTAVEHYVAAIADGHELDGAWQIQRLERDQLILAAATNGKAP